MARSHSKTIRRLLPANSLVFVSETKITRLNPNAITLGVVGQKTFGLCSLPEVWTLPFFGISAELFKCYESVQKKRGKILSLWMKSILTAGQEVGIKPGDEVLVRSSGSGEGITARGKFHSTLKKIGEHAKAKGAIIVLEGAVLSHAYYQLLSTGATVEVVHPFIGFEERHDYNKLVRDKIPEQIWHRGESIITAQLHDDALVRALKEKLVEEAYELLDAKDLQSIVAELADIREVVDSLIQKLKVPEKEVAEEQTQKRHKRGGFSKGIVLVETESKPPTSISPEFQEHLKGLQSGVKNIKEVDEAEVRRRGERLDKKTDRRKIDGKVEIKASISVPVTRSTPWDAETPEERIESTKGKVVAGSIRGVRSGNRWNIEVSVYIDQAQLELFRD